MIEKMYRREDTMETIKSKLSMLRKQMNKTQEQIANELGIARTTYAMYEQGNRTPDYEILIKLAHYYNTTTDYLLGLSSISNPDEKYQPNMTNVIQHPEVHWNGKQLTEKQKNIAHDILKSILKHVD